jgi:protein SCO1
MIKIVSIILFYIILTAGLIVYFLFNRSPITLEKGVYISQPKSVIKLELVDNKGNLFTEAQLKGHWSLLFFGFSSCELVCPMTLSMLNQTHEGLPNNKKPKILFISVDPKRDSLPVLNQYMAQFNSHFTALRGEMKAINELQKQLHVSVSSTPMTHGNEILLINPEARVQAYFYYPISAKALISDLKRLIN